MLSKLMASCTGTARRPRWLRVTGAGTAWAALLVLAAGGVAAASGTATPNRIKACYQPAKTPATLTIPHGSTCPAKDKTLTWNKVGPPGPQGPPGALAGLSAMVPPTSLALSAGTWKAVLTTQPVPASGSYYVTASAVLNVSTGDQPSCEIGWTDGVVNLGSGYIASVGPVPAAGFQTIGLTSPVVVPATDRLVLYCIATAANTTTSFSQGALTATLISHPIAGAPRAHAGVRLSAPPRP